MTRPLIVSSKHFIALMWCGIAILAIWIHLLMALVATSVMPALVCHWFGLVALGIAMHYGVQRLYVTPINALYQVIESAIAGSTAATMQQLDTSVVNLQHDAPAAAAPQVPWHHQSESQSSVTAPPDPFGRLACHHPDLMCYDPDNDDAYGADHVRAEASVIGRLLHFMCCCGCIVIRGRNRVYPHQAASHQPPSAYFANTAEAGVGWSSSAEEPPLPTPPPIDDVATPSRSSSLQANKHFPRTESAFATQLDGSNAPQSADGTTANGRKISEVRMEAPSCKKDTTQNESASTSCPATGGLSSREVGSLLASLRRLFDVTNIFSRYVPKEVVADLLQVQHQEAEQESAPVVDGFAPQLRPFRRRFRLTREMHLRRITLLFCDIEGFTTLCERVELMHLVDLLELYFGAMTKLLMQHGCTVDKYIGDAIMGFWGAPLDYHTQGFSACCTALHMQWMVHRLRNRFAVYGHRLQVRVGLHHGAAAVGNIGCRSRISYTALGDAVNTAARLEALNKHFGTCICVSQPVLDDIDSSTPLFATRALGAVRVKGKVQALQVHELIGVRLNASIGSAGSRKASGIGGMLDAVTAFSSVSTSTTEKFPDLNVEAEWLSAKKFRAVSDKQLYALSKLDVAVSQYQRLDIHGAIETLTAALDEHHRVFEVLDVSIEHLRGQVDEWTSVAAMRDGCAGEEGLTAGGTPADDSSRSIVFDGTITMTEK